jgi:hypothetical protein
MLQWGVVRVQEPEFVLPAVVGVLVGIGLIVLAVVQYRRYRLIANTPTKAIRSLSVGRTEIQGTARVLDDVLSQPFEDGRCLYRSWEIESYTSSGSDSKSWSRVAHGKEAVPFLVEDGTGSVRVTAREYATWELSADLTTEVVVDQHDDPPAEVADFCEQQGIDPAPSVKRRYTQTVYQPGADAYVFGEARERYHGETVGMANNERLEIHFDATSRVFVISNLDENLLIDRFGQRAPAYALGGILLSAISLYVALFF